MIFVIEVDNDGFKVFNTAGNAIDPAKDSSVQSLLTTLNAIKDTAGIKKITDALPAGTNLLGKVTCFLYDDVNNVAMAVAGDITRPTNTRGLLTAGVDALDTVHLLHTDGDGNLRVANQPPQPPPGTTAFVLAVLETNLEIGAPPTYHETESSAVANNAELHLQLFTAGAAGDPSERGSRVDIFWREGGGPTDHVIERMYVSGQSVTITLPDVHQSRDGTALTGDGSTTKLVIRRYRLSNADAEVDAIVRGYTE